MQWLGDWITELSHYSRDYLSLISLSLVALLLVTVGKSIAQWNNRWINRFPALIQLPVRAIINLTVFGAILYYFPGWLEQLLDLFNNLTLAPVILVVILSSGALSNRYI